MLYPHFVSFFLIDLFLFDLNDKWDQPLSPTDVQAMFYEIYGEDDINSDPHAQRYLI